MDSTELHKHIRNILFDRDLKDEQLFAAEKAAFLGMAHFLDLPTAEVTGNFSVTSGTESYNAINTVDAPVDAVIDRVTAAVFYTATSQSVLNEINMTAWMHNYHGQTSTARQGMPNNFVLYNNKFYLYPEPNLSGTVYYSAQRVLTDISDFPESYFPLMVELVRMYIAKPDTWEANRAWQLSKQLIKSFKGPMHPKKSVMPMSTHRAARVKRLNQLI